MAQNVSYDVTVAGATSGINVVFPADDITSIAVGKDIFEKRLLNVFPGSYDKITALKVIGGIEFFSMYYTFSDDYDVFLPALQDLFIEAVKDIDSGTFADYVSLERIRLPKWLEFIGAKAFCKVTGGSATFETPEKLPNISEFVVESLKNWCHVDLEDCFSNPCFSMAHGAITEENVGVVSSLDSGNINGATRIGAYTFINCQTLTAINLPSSVTEIRQEAFSKCTDLTTAVFPDSIARIEDKAFEDCSALSSLTTGSGMNLAWLGLDVFKGCSSLHFDTSTIPGLVIWNGYVISADSIPSELTIASNGVKGFANRLFTGNTSITKIVLGGGIVQIPDDENDYWGAFGHCTNMTSVTLQDNVAVVSSNSFHDCTSLASLSLCATIIEIGDHAFLGCTNLSSVVLPSNLQKIGEEAFCRCGIATIAIPDSVIELGDTSFAACSSLSSVTLGGGLTEIPYQTFAGCVSLGAITIPGNIKKIGDAAFSMDGWPDASPLPNNLTNVTFENGVEEIAPYAFYYCNEITSLVFPNSLTILGPYAFAECTSLESLEFGSGIREVDEYCFQGCEGLKTMTFFGNAPNVGDGAFDHVPTQTCKVRVSRTSTGWGDTGRWQGFSIEYFD